MVGVGKSNVYLATAKLGVSGDQKNSIGISVLANLKIGDTVRVECYYGNSYLLSYQGRYIAFSGFLPKP